MMRLLLTVLFLLPLPAFAWDDDDDCRVCDCASPTENAKATVAALTANASALCACNPTCVCDPAAICKSASAPTVQCARGRCKVRTFSNGTKRSVCRYFGCSSSTSVE